MLRRLHHDQPESFAFTDANEAWARAQMTKFPEGRQASAVIPILWRAQEQEGWLTRPAIEHVAAMLGMDKMRVLEVATFYFMFQLAPVGRVAHIQICGTTSCMICGAEDLIGVCREKIADQPHEISADGKFSWEEVECLGACTNAPMAQIGKDYYEDLTAERLAAMIDEMAAGGVPVPGPQNGRFTSEPLGGATVLKALEGGEAANASVALATSVGDSIKRIDGTEVPLRAAWLGADEGATLASLGGGAGAEGANTPRPAVAPKPKAAAAPVKAATPAPAPVETADAPTEADRPAGLEAAREGGPDDLKLIKGVGPKLEKLLHSLGYFHFDQVAAWTAREVGWVDANLEGFKGRVSRDDWVAQARILASGGTTDFAEKQKDD